MGLQEISKKKIAIIGTVGIPAKYGGFETLVEFMTRDLNLIYDFTVYCSAKSYQEKSDFYNGSKLRYINLHANGAQSILYDFLSLIKSVGKNDIILVLGVSGAVFLPIIRLFFRVKIITNIDGLEWKRDKWNYLVKLFLKISESIAVKSSHMVVADNKAISDYIKITYKRESHLIEYGGDHSSIEPLSTLIIDEYPVLKTKYAFKVCRIEPENNIEIILKAFSRNPQVNFVLIGNWQGSDYGSEMRLRYKNFNNLFLLDPIYNQKILDQFRSNCFFYVHGHSAGGTNPSLVEAMNLGLPIFAFSVNYNIETTGGKARYFKNELELSSLLESIDKIDLLSLGREMQVIAKEKYAWEIINNKYKMLFNS